MHIPDKSQFKIIRYIHTGSASQMFLTLHVILQVRGRAKTQSHKKIGLIDTVALLMI